MKKYMLKRILFSIFSLLMVVMAVMLLVYSLIERSVIFQTDDTWNKKSGNDRSIYEYVQYEKYGYLEYEDYTSFVANKYIAIYGDEYVKQEDYKRDRDAIQNPDTYMDNETVQEFIAQYHGDGYTIRYLKPNTYKSGRVKPGGTGYLLAVIDAYVDAELSTFDISDDLSLHLEPTIIQTTSAKTLGREVVPGVKFTLSY